MRGASYFGVGLWAADRCLSWWIVLDVSGFGLCQRGKTGRRP